MYAVLAIAALLLIAVFVVIGIYNNLVRSRNEVKNAWSQIDVQLKRRHDLIPNLVETCKGYMEHEQQTLQEVTRLRNSAASANDRGKQIEVENQLTKALAGLNVVFENYPDLKANQNFLSVQEELTSTENKIGFARQYYNDAVLTYNNSIQVFPNNILAGMFNFKEDTYFQVEEPVERAVPKVSFS